MTRELTNLQVQRVDLVDRAAVRDPDRPDQPSRFLVWKSETAPDDPTREGVPMIQKAATPPEGSPEEEADETSAEAQAEGDKPATGNPFAKKKPVAKEENVTTETATPEVVTKADFEAVQKRAEDAEKIAKEERDMRERAESVAKAEKEFAHLPGTSQDKGAMLHELRKSVTPELFSKVESVFKSAEEMAAKSVLFTSMGSAGSSNGAGSAYAEIEAKAAELRKSDPKLTEAQAITKATSDNPELYRRYRQESV